MDKHWRSGKKAWMFFSFLLLFSAVVISLFVKGTRKQERIFPVEDPFTAISYPTWNFEMEGIALTSSRGNGLEFKLHADSIKCRPVKRGGITFVNYSHLVIENARITLERPVVAKAASPGPLTIGPEPILSHTAGNGGGASNQDAGKINVVAGQMTDDALEIRPTELFNIFSDLVGGSKRYVLGTRDLENGAGNTKVIVEVTAYPLELEIRSSNNRSVKIQAGQCIAEMGSTDVVLSGGAVIGVSVDQKLSCKKIHCLGSFHEFMTEGAYVFETDGNRVQGENGFFTLSNGRIALSDGKCRKAGNGNSLNPVRFLDAMLARATADKGNSKALNLFARLFLGSFQPESLGFRGDNLKRLKAN